MKKIYYILMPVVLIILYFSFSGGGQSDEDYIAQIEKEREEKEDYMRTSSESPFKDSLETYSGLNYFPPNPDYVVKAEIRKFEKNEYVTISESDGSDKQYLKYATASFTLKNTPMQLLILKPAGFGAMNVLFTAFADETSGESTYGGGRYLDLDFKNAKRITIDFNKAYSPYCDYNPTFACPLPPRENILPVAIEAGEKKYK